MAATRKNRGRTRVSLRSAPGSMNRALRRGGTAFPVAGPKTADRSTTAKSLLKIRSLLPANTGPFGSGTGINPRAVPAFRRKKG